MPDPIYAQVGENIRRAREARGMTQGVLAKKVSLVRTSVTNIEAGAQSLTLHVLLTIASALRVDPAALLPQGATSIEDKEEKPTEPEGFASLLGKLSDPGRVSR